MAKRPFPQEAWDKLYELLQEARINSTLRDILQKGPPDAVRNKLRDDFGITADELTDLIAEFENVADRNSLQWWSPIH